MKYIIRFQRNISRILFHILIKYIYIPFIFSITLMTFLLHWLTHTHTLPRNEILFFLHPDTRRDSFQVIYPLQDFQKKKNRNRISSKNRIIFFHSTKPLWPFIWLDEKYYLSLRISNTENATKKTYPFEIENFIDVIPRRIFRTKKYRNISQKRF